MPYKLSQQHGEWCVVNRDSGKPVQGGCHADRKAALQHMKALYANVKDAKPKGKSDY